MTEDNKKNDNNKGSDGSATGMCVGMALGVTAGLLIYVLTGEILLMPLCLGIGMCLGIAFGSKGKKGKGTDKTEDKQDPEK